MYNLASQGVFKAPLAIITLTATDVNIPLNVRIALTGETSGPELGPWLMLLGRARALGIDLDNGETGERVQLSFLDPRELSQGRLFERIQEAVDSGVRVVVIDSLTGLVRTLATGNEMLPQFAALLSFLKRKGVATVMTLNVESGQPPIDLSFITDNTIRLSHYSKRSRIGRAIWVDKKRYGPHSREMRALGIGEGGVTLDELDADVTLTPGPGDGNPA